MYRTATTASPSTDRTGKTPATLSEKALASLQRGIETAERESHLLREKGYSYAPTMPSGSPCEPGVFCVTRPAAAIKPGESAHYLVSLRSENGGCCAECWAYTCDCAFYQRTERALGRGECKHGKWILREFLTLLAGRETLSHVLATLPAAPPSRETVYSTARNFARNEPELLALPAPEPVTAVAVNTEQVGAARYAPSAEEQAHQNVWNREMDKMYPDIRRDRRTLGERVFDRLTKRGRVA